MGNKKKLKKKGGRYSKILTPDQIKNFERFGQPDLSQDWLEIFTPDMEDNKNLSYTLSEWIKYFINTSLTVIRDMIEFGDNNKDTLEIYDKHVIIINELCDTLSKLINEKEIN